MARQLSIRPFGKARQAGPAVPPRRRAPRFVSRVLATSFPSVLAVFAAISTVLVMQTRAVVERGATDDLAAAQRQLAGAERERHQDAVLRATLIGLNQELKRGLEAYQNERAFGADEAAAREYLDLLRRQIEPVSHLLRSDVMAITGWDGRVVASAGARAADWPAGTPIVTGEEIAAGATETIVRGAGTVFWTTVAPIVLRGERVGHLVEGHAIDAKYAAGLADGTRSDVVVLVDGRVAAATGAAAVEPGLPAALAATTAQAGAIDAGGKRYAYLRLGRVGPAATFAVASITAGRDRATAAALPTLLAIGAGGLLLCALASLWLAERVAAPIDQVSRDICAMVEAHAAAPLAVQPPSIQELDTLTESFNRLMQTVRDARSETDAAYVGAIGALAAALDARDPYTAGHSERVSLLSVEMGRAMALGQDDLDVLRLGALLHDIGKIGIGDAILGKPSPLNDAEYEAIKRHTLLGAQILRPVGFLHRHIPIVELHHERADGSGYPHGLRGEEIPLLARIVHVADAFDAMTTARAYRSALPATDALVELCRHVGTDFDPAALDALAAVVTADQGAERRAS
jgi:putative nucleotidyltransferase with HDIG domain